MAIHRSVGQFNEEIEDWTAYFERLVQYFTANNIEADEKRRAVLLTVCGAHIYQLVRSLVSPGKPTEKSFGDSEAGSRPFDTTTIMLFAEPKLTFTKAFELAQAAELAERSLKDVVMPVGAAVHSLQEPKPTTATGLWIATSVARRGIWLEFAEARSKSRLDGGGNSQQICCQTRWNPTRSSKTCYTLFNLKGVSAAPFRISVVINNASLDMEVDTGAAISEVIYNKLEKVEKELERLEKEGTIDALQSSEWAAPIVPAMKRDGSIRLCGDYKLTAITALRNIFSTHGLPEMLVSDNGSAFTGIEFQTCGKEWYLAYIQGGHPILKTTGDVQTRLARFLFQYRLTPHSSTGLSPTEMLLGRCPRSHLDLIHPDTSVKVERGAVRRHIDHVKLRVSTSDQQDSGHASPEQDEDAMDLSDQDVKDHDVIEDKNYFLSQLQ
ncbi:hypothetical protein EMCRGX_G026540 [Ephydatia muelleri]